MPDGSTSSEDVRAPASSSGQPHLTQNNLFVQHNIQVQNEEHNTLQLSLIELQQRAHLHALHQEVQMQAHQAQQQVQLESTLHQFEMHHQEAQLIAAAQQLSAQRQLQDATSGILSQAQREVQQAELAAQRAQLQAQQQSQVLQDQAALEIQRIQAAAEVRESVHQAKYGMVQQRIEDLERQLAEARNLRLSYASPASSLNGTVETAGFHTPQRNPSVKGPNANLSPTSASPKPPMLPQVMQPSLPRASPADDAIQALLTQMSNLSATVNTLAQTVQTLQEERHVPIAPPVKPPGALRRVPEFPVQFYPPSRDNP